MVTLPQVNLATAGRYLEALERGNSWETLGNHQVARKPATVLVTMRVGALER
jgi:hypothetical protein